MNRDELIKYLGFSDADVRRIEQLNIPLENIKNQIEIFLNGIPSLQIERPASLNDGILYYSDQEFNDFAVKYHKLKPKLNIKQFVPASGAATRMFPFLVEFLKDFDLENNTINSYINHKNATQLKIFFTGLDKFPFYHEVVRELLSENANYFQLEDDHKKYLFTNAIITNNKFGFANKPKAVLPFHKYKNHIATPIEEHLKEGIVYASSNNSVNLHFTITEQHQKQFNEIVSKVKHNLEKKEDVKINVSYSYQKTSTNTIAVSYDNKPFRDDNNNLVFRPGGHGALIENLNELDADLIFIKNIDNVIQDHIEQISVYKMGLAGILLEIQSKVFAYLNKLENCKEEDILEIISFMKERLNIFVGQDFNKLSLENKKAFIEKELQRPIRVCGMVKNEGEPGGGPFWLKTESGRNSLQIIELSQIDLQNPALLEKLDKATHFNPVDIVCAVKNHRGEKYDLTKYTDPNSGFIVEKTYEGRKLKGYELPGLWNGAMANWISIFVQVPLITFNPVKTVNDLLKPAHQRAENHI